MRYLFFLSLVFLSTFSLKAQYTIYGSTEILGNNCFRLTPDSLYKVGTIWNRTPFDLNNPFQINLDLYFGVNDAGGADGMTFIMYTDTATFTGNIGNGSHIGYGNYSPSLAVEFDTWQNTWDSAYDHIAITKNGEADHSVPGSLLAGPVSATQIVSNIEDGAIHNAQIIWDPVAQTMDVYFDCNFRIRYTGDIIDSIFGGNPNIYWGFTASTGGARNRQEVCITYNTMFYENIKDTTICSGNSYTLNLPPTTYAYLWGPMSSVNQSDPYNPIFTPTANTSYYLSFFGSCNEIYIDSFNLSLSSVLPNPNLGADKVVCIGNTVGLSASGGGSYAWSPASGLSATNIANPIFTGTISNSYVVTVTSPIGCVNTDTIGVLVNNLPTAQASSDIIVCQGATTALSASGGIFYSWSPPSGLSATNVANPTLTGTFSGNYIVTVTDIAGCSDTDTLYALVNPSPTANAGSTVVVCQGQTVSLSGSGGGTYSWSPSTGLSATNIASPVFTGTTNSTYVLTVQNNFGCNDADTVSVVLSGLSNTVITPSASQACIGDTIQLATNQVVLGYAYFWSPSAGLLNGTSSNSNEALLTSAGIISYTLLVSDQLGCTSSASVTLTSNALPIIDAGDNITTCFDSTIALNANTNATIYSWQTAFGIDDLTSLTPNVTLNSNYPQQMYVLVGSNSNCTNRDTVYVFAEDCAPLDSSFIDIPNVFTPNSDGFNDQFVIKSNGIKEFEFKIFNRWGLILYQSTNPTESWNGRNESGKQESEGTYYYTIKATSIIDDKKYDLKGYFTLLK